MAIEAGILAIAVEDTAKQLVVGIKGSWYYRRPYFY